MPSETKPSTDWLAVTARSQAYLCLKQAELDDAPISERASFLMTLGLSRADAAGLLGSTDESLRVQMAKAAKKAAAKNG